jgi:hypothetical protein
MVLSGGKVLRKRPRRLILFVRLLRLYLKCKWLLRRDFSVLPLLPC